MSQKEFPKFSDAKIRFEFPQFIATNLQEQINLADNKAALTFSVLAVATGALLSRFPDLDWSSASFMRSAMLMVISAIILIIAFKAVIHVIYPRLNNGNKTGFVYFEDIASQDKKSYTQKALALTEEELIEEMHHNSHALALVASRKFKALKKAMLVGVIALIWTIFVLIVTSLS